MPGSNTPSGAAAQPNDQASLRHDAVTAGAPDPGTQPSLEASSPHSDREPASVEQPAGAPQGSPSGGWSSQHPHVFHLANWSPDAFEGGTLQGATEENWKILSGQQASVYLAKLEPGGVREPHWHPSAWELNFVMSGTVRWSFAGPADTHDTFEAEAGDLVFAPQGHLHYFENASETEELVVLIIFNAGVGEPQDDIGIVASLSAVPPDVLGAVFNASPEAFRSLPHKLTRVTIARKPK